MELHRLGLAALSTAVQGEWPAPSQPLPEAAGFPDILDSLLVVRKHNSVEMGYRLATAVEAEFRRPGRGSQGGWLSSLRARQVPAVLVERETQG